MTSLPEPRHRWTASTLLATLLMLAAIGHAQAQTTVHLFEEALRNPGAMVLGPDGRLYGMFAEGGRAGSGGIFSLGAGETEATLEASFDFGTDVSATNGLIEMQGMLYGAVSTGGSNDHGMIVRFDPASDELQLVQSFEHFTTGSVPMGGLAKMGSYLVGTAMYGGNANLGTVFFFDPATANLGLLFEFMVEAEGGHPTCTLLAKDGLLYGTTPTGGANGKGRLFRLDPTTGILTTMFSFGGPDGESPSAPLIDVDGVLYGSTVAGGSLGYGTIFRLDLATELVTTVAQLDGVMGSNRSHLLRSGQFLYGTGYSVFRLDLQNDQLSSFASLGTVDPDDSTPWLAHGLVEFDGKFFGSVAGDPGEQAWGGIYSVDPNSAVVTVIENFRRPEGWEPQGVVRSSGGMLYGATAKGGMHKGGTIYRFDPALGAAETLIPFGPGSDVPGNPTGGLLEMNGMFFGTTSGALFRFDPATEATTVLVTFDGTNGSPVGGLAAVGDALYGTTQDGGTHGVGTLFRYESQIQSFTTPIHFSGPNGARPESLLVEWNGFLYGTTSGGGTTNYGTVFRFDPVSQVLTTIATFDSAGGYTPRAEVIPYGGMLYGTTSVGGALGRGTVFRLDPATGDLAHLVDFIGTNGANPLQGLTETGGKLFGVALLEGAEEGGTLFVVDPESEEMTTLHHFPTQSYPASGLVEAVPGALFGTLRFGGSGNGGTIFTLLVDPPTISPSTVDVTAGSPGAELVVATVSDSMDEAAAVSVRVDSTHSDLTIGTLSNVAGVVSGVVEAQCTAAPGAHLVSLEAENSRTLTSAADLVVNVDADTPPSLSSYPDTTAGAGTPLTVHPVAAHSDNGTFSLALVTPDGFTGEASIQQTGAISISNPNRGDHTLTVVAEDNCGLSSQQTFVLSVSNRPPTIQPVGDQSTPENATLSFVVTATDADGDSLTYGATGLPDGAAIDSGSGAFTWTPGYDQSGSYDVSLTASDGTDMASETITITVTNVNRAPVLSAIGDRSVDESALLSFSIVATDPDGDAVTYSATGLPSGATLHANSGAFSWTPSHDQSGSYPVTFTASDGTAIDSETITITVTNVPTTVTTVIKAVHLTELRTAVNAVRLLAGLGSASWTDPNPQGVVIKAIHWTELRDRLNEARAALGLPSVAFPIPVTPGAVIQEAHVEALRAGVR